LSGGEWLDVEHCHVRRVLLDQGAGHLTIVGLGHDLDIVGALEELADSRPDHDMTISHDDANPITYVGMPTIVDCAALDTSVAMIQ
jgi:hypothetical protein